MAGLITITNVSEIQTAIYVNVHALQETAPGGDRYRERLETWKGLYFAALDPQAPRQRLGLIWTVPTIQLINSTPKLANDFDITLMDPIINLVQNTIQAVAFAGLSAPEQAAVVSAFNTAWT